MPYSTEVIENGKGILHIGTGMVTGGDLMSSASTVFDLIKQGLRPEYGLTDLSDVTDFAVSAGEIEKNAELNSTIARHLPSIRLAIVAPADNIYGMARMWQAHTDRTGWTSRVFRTKAEALAWLKQEPGVEMRVS
jgi:hypothetical protein